MAKGRVKPLEARPPASGAGRAGIWSPPELKPENEELLADFSYVLGWLLKGDGSVYKYKRRKRARTYTEYVAKFKNKDYAAIKAANGPWLGFSSADR